MRFILGLLIIAISALVRGQEIDILLPEGSGEEITETTPITYTPLTKTKSPEELREENFNQEISYLFLIPKLFYVQTKERICLLVTKCQTVLEYRVTLLLPNGNEYWSSGEKEAEQGESCFEFDVPAIESRSSQQLTVRLQLRRNGAEDVNDDDYEVTKERFVSVQARGGLKTFVQTDKPIYQPGQTVRFRALTLNSELKTITDPFESVVVESPTGQRINQWLNVETQEGLIDLEHELPDEPQLGAYSIKVNRGSEQVTERFTVEEYVLPRFEVEIRTPPYILITDTTCKIKVCGIYTYGKPVQGSVEANVTAGGGRYDYLTRTRTSREVLQFSIPTTDADGCAVIDVDLTRLELSSTRFYVPSSLSVDATFTETATGEKVTKSDKSSPKVSRSVFSLQFVTDNYFFKPGLPYFGVIDVTNPDGSPRSGENLVVRCNRLNSPVGAISDDQGLAVYRLPVEGLNYAEFNSRDSLSCNVTSRNFPDIIPYNGDTYNLLRPISFLSRNPLYSPSNNYLDVEPLIGQTQSGQEVNLRVHMTTDCPGGPRILAVSRGNIIHDFKFKAGLQETANGIVYDVSFVLTQSMTPLLDLLVYGLLDDGEMIADSLEIESNAVLENQVHIQVADGQNAQLTPGAPTSIEISATPGSLCAIGVVDKSVHLLGGDNQIKTTDVVSFLNTFQLSGGDSLNAPCQDAEFEEPDNNWELEEPILVPFIDAPEPVVLARKKRQIGFFPRYRPTPYPLYTDVTEEFEKLGLVRISNLNIETSPCKQPEPFPFPLLIRAEANFAFAQADFQSVSAVGVAAGPVIRSYFPETWLWNIQRSEESPTVYVPDTITEWIGSGFCISSISGFGVSEPFTVNAFKPFFADYNLPYSVIRGEELELQVNIFNYLEKCLPVAVTLARTSEFEIVEGSNRKYSCVCSSSEPTQVTFNIRPLSLGDVDLETTVVVVYDNNICGTRPVQNDVKHSDGLRKPILVEPEGEEVENSLSLYFCPSEEDGGIFRHTFEVIVPDEYVEDSGRVIIFLSGDILGNSLTNIDRLLKIPYGCGEQNMIGFVPNIYALQYLQATDQSSQAQVDKALSNMRKGYQKQLNYRRIRGSYSAFGNGDAEGSAWLTAYVVRSFAQAGQFIPIDENDLQVSIRWLYNALGQNENGCFRSRGRVIHKEMQGGVNDEVSLTAFILVSLLEAGESKDNPFVANALSCVRNSLASLTDTYSAALIAYALSIAEDPSVSVALVYLESVAINEGGVKYWVSNRPQTQSSRSYRYGATASSLSIEMSAYMLLTYIKVYGTDAIAPGSPISKWLVSQQGPNGGFRSSQDTVVAIHALAEYARLLFGGQANLAVAIGYQEPCTLSSIFVIHDSNRLVLQRADLEHFPSLITAIATGDGCALLQVIIRFNVHPALPPQPAFTLSYNVGPTTQPDACQRSFKLNICVSYTGDDGFSNMAIVEVKLVTGFAPEPSSIELLKSGFYRDLTRVEYRQKKVVMYFHQFTANPYCFDLEVKRVHFIRNPKPGLITVYDYYDTALTLTTEYEMDCQFIGPPAPIPLPIEIQPVEEGPVEVADEEPIQALPALPAEDNLV